MIMHDFKPISIKEEKMFYHLSYFQLFHVIIFIQKLSFLFICYNHNSKSPLGGDSLMIIHRLTKRSGGGVRRPPATGGLHPGLV